MNERRPRKRRTQRAERGRRVRELAAGLIGGVLDGRGAARTHVDRAIGREGLEGRDAGLLTELVYGVIRRLATLDSILEAHVRGGLGRVEDDVLLHLRVGAYQLAFLDRIPAAAAVNEAVACIRRKSARGFVNGVLRGIGRSLVGSQEEADDVPWSRRVLGRESGWVVFHRDIVPDRERDPAGWLAAAGSMPRGVVERWLARAEFETVLGWVRGHNAPPRVVLRANRLRGTRDELLEALKEAGAGAEPGTRPEAVILGGTDDAAWASLWQGRATVQDETAMAVAPLLDPQPGERVVDLCAAPGGKTTHLAELMGDQGRVDALDVSASRLERVERAAVRLGLTSIAAAAIAADQAEPPEGPPVDRVLVDVPCSNSGVLRRRVEARWRLEELDRAALRGTQDELLRRAAGWVRPGGVVVYSTCSIEPEENQEVVAAFVAEHPGWRVVEERSADPSVGSADGGYMAKLVKPE